MTIEPLLKINREVGNPTFETSQRQRRNGRLGGQVPTLSHSALKFRQLSPE
jgi:hypothetical protein